jgi:IclR family pca regulon transcriptional regulator
MPKTVGDGSRVATDPAKYRVEALAKGLALLTLFSGARHSLRLKEICDLTSIPMPTAFRLLATLREAGYVERMPDDSYRPGVRVLTLGYAALRGMDLVQSAEGPLRELARSTGLTVNLALLNGDRVLYIACHRNGNLVTANITVGSTLPAVRSSLGKALLADLTDEQVAAVIGADSFAAGGGPNAVGSLQELLTQLHAIRREGIAVQDQEVAYGLRAVAAPVRGADGRAVAAANIAVNAAEYALADLLDRFAQPLLATTEEISRRLGDSSAAADVRPTPNHKEVRP